MPYIRCLTQELKFSNPWLKSLLKAKTFLMIFSFAIISRKRTPQLYAEVNGVEKPMPANVDLYSGFVYDALDIPTTIATPLFATARLSGWCAHRIEELIAGGKLMRPAYKSVQQPRGYVELADRVSESNGRSDKKRKERKET